MSLEITTTEVSLPANQPILAVLEASGNAGPVQWSLMSGSQLPGGLTLDQSGRLGGTAGISGTFTITVSAFDTGSLDPSDGGEAEHVPGQTVGAQITLILS